jgi:hypothetical protein
MESRAADGPGQLVDVTATAGSRRRDRRLRRIGRLAVPIAFVLGFAVAALSLRNVLATGPLLLADLVGGTGAAVGAWYAFTVRLPSGPPPRRPRPGRDVRLGGHAMFGYYVLAWVYWGWFFLAMIFLLVLAVALPVHPAVVLLVLVLNGWIAGALFRRLRGVVFRWAGRSSPAAVARDGRRPVLFLRSFELEEVRLSGARRSLGYGGRGSFQAVLIDRLWQLGPVIATARPKIDRKLGEAVLDARTNRLYYQREGKIVEGGTEVATAGGPRWRIPSADWQRQVDSWLRTAALIVVVVGGSRGLSWELGRIRTLEAAGRLLIVVPPLGSLPMPPAATDADRHRALARLWSSTAQHLADPRVDLPPWIDARYARLVVPGIGRPAVVITSSGSASADYEAALEAAMPFFPTTSSLADGARGN